MTRFYKLAFLTLLLASLSGEALALCAATTAAKDGNTANFSLCTGTDGSSNRTSQFQLIDTNGALIGSVADALKVNIASGGTLAIGSPTTGSGASLVMGAVTTVAPTTYVNTQNHPLALDLNGNLRTALSAALPAGTNLLGHVIIDTGSTTAVSSLPATPAGTNQIGHVIVDTSSTTAVTQATASSLNATVVGTAGAALATSANQTSSLASVAAGTAPSQMQVAGGQYLATAPTLTDTQTIAMQVDIEGRTRVSTQASTSNWVGGTASQTGTTSTSLISLVASRRLYITSFSCDNSGASTSKILFQDGSAGTTIGTTIVPAGGGSNQGSGTPLFRTTSGNALFFAPQTASTTVQCTAAGFSGV